jgi:hypothetical protein
MGDGKLIEAMGTQSVPSLQHTPRGAGHGLIGIGIVLLLYGVYFGHAIMQYDVVQLDQVSRVDAVPGEAFGITVPGPGRYRFYTTKSIDLEAAQQSRWTSPPGAWGGSGGALDDPPTREHARRPDEVRSVYADGQAQARDGGWVVTSPEFPHGDPNTSPSPVWAVPTVDPPAGIHRGTLERDVATAVIGAVLLVVGLVLRTRFVRATRAEAERIEASLRASETGPDPG